MSEILEKIDKKTLVPKLRFKEFNEELKSTKFGEVVESNLYGPRFNANDYSQNGNVKTIRGTDLGVDGEIKYEQVPLALLDKKMVETHKLKDGDIVMITTAECGAVGVYRKQKIDYLSSAYGVRIRLNESGYPYFFKYFFQTRLAKKEINSYIRKATVANLPGSDILKIKLNIPTLPEQQEIASFLTTVDEKIQQLTRKKELLEQYKKGVMQQLFSGELRFKPALSNVEGDENGKNYPDWEEKQLGELCESIKSGKSNVSDEGTFPLYGSTGIIGKCLVASHQGLFILIARVGANAGTINLVEDQFGVSDNTLVLKCNKLSNIAYIYFYLGFYNLNRLIFGSGQPLITGGQLKTLKLSLPSLSEQKKISSFLSSFDTKIESVDKQIKQTQNFKKGLLQQMFV